nr:prolyl oligopeptidase family serine peptidase [Rhodocaloribacter litoris]
MAPPEGVSSQTLRGPAGRRRASCTPVHYRKSHATENGVVWRARADAGPARAGTDSHTATPCGNGAPHPTRRPPPPGRTDLFYYTRYEPGKDYPILARRRGTLDAPEEILLDVNELAKDHTFYQLGGTAVSDDGRLLAFAADTLGRRLYTVYVKNLETGQLLPETLYPTTGNVQARAYPAMLVTAGLHDSQVQYWEPAKWVARLRDLKTDDNLLLLKTNMAAGHGGASGRFQRYREIATEYAFFIGLAEGRL